MARVTWIGEEDLHGPDSPGPSWTTWRGIRFDKGEPVDITDMEVLAKAKGNRFFKVEGGPGRPPKSLTGKVGTNGDEDPD
jgi:hypothetical protein